MKTRFVIPFSLPDEIHDGRRRRQDGDGMPLFFSFPFRLSDVTLMFVL